VKIKIKGVTTEKRRDEAATKKQDLCTTEARRHGESKKWWDYFGPLVPWLCPKTGFRYFQTLSPAER
jgi:hypothetical protein